MACSFENEHVHSSSSHADAEESMDIDVDHEHHQAAKRTSSGAVKNSANSPTVYYGSSDVPSTSATLPQAVEPSQSASSRRRKIKVRRILLSSGGNLSEDLTHYICVLDTNVILDNLNGLKSLISSNHNTNRTCNKGSFSIYKIIVPMVVFQELDGLKMSNREKSLTNTAQNAIKFLNSQLTLPNGFIQGEPDKNPENRMSECTLPVENNDDRILDCCIRLTELYPDKTVILLSGDINLRNKALTWKVEATPIDTFIKKFKFSGKASSPKVIGPNPMEVEQVKEEVGEPKQKRHKTNLKFISKGPVPNSTVSNSKAIASGSKSDDVSSNTTSSIDSLKTELETALLKLIVSQLEKQYGKTWTTVFSKFNPKVATLTDFLKLLKNNWLGVFSDCFHRDITVINTIKSLLDFKSAKSSSLQNQLYSKLLTKVKGAT